MKNPTRKPSVSAITSDPRFLPMLLNNLPGMVYHCRNDKKWTMLFLSDYCKTLTGYKPEELLSNKKIAYADLIHPDDRQKVWEGVQAGVRKHQPFQLEYRIRTKNGDEKWVREQGCVVRGSKGRYLEGFIMDVTEHRLSMERLTKEKEWSELLLNKAPNIIVGLGEDSNIIVFNKFAEELTGYKASEVIGKRWIDLFIPKEDQKKIYGIWNDIVRKKRVDHHFIHAVKAKKGKENRIISWGNTLLTENGMFKMVLSIGEDITKKQEAEKQLEKNEKKYRDIVENSTDMIHSVGRDNKILFANKRECELLGYSMKELIGKDLYDLYSRDTWEAVLKGFNRLKREGYLYVPDGKMVKKNGDELDVEISSIAIFDSKGRFRKTRSIIHDITERKKNEQKLARVNRALRTISLCNQELVRAEDETELLKAMCRLLVDEGGYRFVWVGFAENDKRKTIRPAARAGFGKGYLDAIRLTWSDRTKYGRGPAGRAIRTGQTVTSQNISSDSAFKPWQKEAARRGYASCIAVPILMAKKPMGALVIYGKAPDLFDQSEVVLLEELAGDIGYGLHALRARRERDRLTDELKENEQKYRAVFENTGAATCIIEPDRTLSLVNSKFEQLSGYSKKELEGKKKWSDFVTKEHLAKMKKYHEERRKKGGKAPTEYEFDFIDKNGNKKRVFIFIDMIPGTKQSVASMLDITERKKIEEKYENLFEAAPDLIAVVDRKARFIDFNKKFIQESGYSRKEMIGKSVLLSGILTKKSVLKLAPLLKSLLSGREVPAFEVEGVAKDGHLVPYELKAVPFRQFGKVTSVLAILRNITERKKAERQLSELVAVVEQTIEGIAIADLDGNITFTNGAWNVMHGYDSKENLRGQHLSIFHTAEQLDTEVIPFNEVLKKRRTNAGEVGHKRKDGTTFPAWMTTTVLNDDKGRPYAIVGIAQDITERKEAAKKIKGAKEHMEQVVSNVHDLIVSFSLNGRIEFITPNVKRYGYSPDEVVGRFVTDFVHPDDRKKVLSDLKKFLRTGEIFPTGFRLLTKNGSYVWMEEYGEVVKEKGKPVRINGVIRDITERREMEEALKKAHDELEKRVQERTEDLAEEKAKSESLLASLGEGVMAIDPKGKVILINNMAESLFGKEAKEVFGKPFMDYYRFEDKAGNVIRPAKYPIADVIRKKKKVSDKIYFVREDGSRLPLFTTFSPIVFKGSLMGIVATFRDISKEEEIRRAKNEFIGLTSHQLRTPLTGTKWLLQAVLKKGKLKEKQAELVDDAIESNNRMIMLVNDLLNISRLEAGMIPVSPKKKDLTVFLKKVAKRIRPDMKRRNHTLKFIKPKQKILIFLDPELIEQMIVNLLSNASKYSEEGTAITLSAKRVGDSAEIHVRDQGIGLTKAEQKKLFDKFFRSDKASRMDTKGTGLGLYIVKKILDTCGGSIRCESKKGKGSTFTVTLPLKGPKARKGNRPLIGHEMS